MTMTTGRFISHLEALITKLESLVQSLPCSSLHPSDTQYETLGNLTLRLITNANELPIQVTDLKARREKPCIEEGDKLITQAQSEKNNVITTAKLKDRRIFAKNIKYFFNGQQDSIVDSEATKTRKKLTRERCERICTLSPNGLISWAVAFMPTLWTANMMSKVTFDYVLEHIQSNDYQLWPPDIYGILSGLGTEEPLRESPKYQCFLKDVKNDKNKAQSANQSRKRRRVSDRATLEGEPLSSLQTTDLIARQHFSPKSISPSETVVSLANNCMAGASLTNGRFNSKVNASTELEKSQSNSVDQQQWTEERIPHVLRPERTGIGTISTLLNDDSSTTATNTQKSLRGSEDDLIEPLSRTLLPGSVHVPTNTPSLRAIQFEKDILQQIVCHQPASILGDIWFGEPPGYPPFVSLRLPSTLSNIVESTGQEVFLPSPSPDGAGKPTRIYEIGLECFMELIKRDGFGVILWNTRKEDASVTMEVLHKGLVEDFIQGSSYVHQLNGEKDTPVVLEASQMTFTSPISGE